jgi:hypothetical protein
MLQVLGERVYVGNGLSFSFQRAGAVLGRGTQAHNLGPLPVHRVLEYPESFPPKWRKPDAVFIPLLAGERIWLGFASAQGRPHAVQIAVEEKNAVTARAWIPRLEHQPQNYLVVPAQIRWEGLQGFDGFEPFSSDSLTNADGTEKSWLVLVYESRSEYARAARPVPRTGYPEPLNDAQTDPTSQPQPTPIPDPYGLQAWRQPAQESVYIHTVCSRRYEKITGLKSPPARNPPDVFGGQRLP